ncbi:MAG TPA: TonB-dependent receptor plug domain-containing protein, partial [Edaphobacter sp.]
MKKPENLSASAARSTAWIAAGTLAVAASATQGILAESRPTGGHNGHHDGQPATIQFDIPAGPLQTVLTQFTQVSGVRAELHLPPDQVAGFHSAGAHGALTPQQALDAILKDTGLGYRLNATGTHAEIQIVNSEQVSVVTSTNSVSLGQFTESLTDTAQTVNVVPQYILQEQAVTSFRDSLRNVPGISLAAGEGGQQGDNLTIRGFTARNDIYLDGIRDFGNYYRDAFDYESVDVIQGPASVEFGRGSTGGVVNQESKQPSTNEFIRTNFQFGTNAMRRGSLDVNVPLRKFIPDSAFRLNLMGTDSGVAGRDVTNVRRWGVAPSLAFGMSRPT